MALPPDRYLEQTVLRQMLNGMLEAVCRERPSSLCAHLFDYLHRSYPDDAAALEGLERKAEALGGWQSRNDIGSSQAALIEFIETTSVRQILETILEAALREQPDNVVVFFMEQLFCTAANEVPPTVPTEADQPAVTTTVEEEKDVAVAGVEPSPPEFPAVDAEASASASSDVVSGAAAEAVLDATVGGVEGGVEGTLLAGSAPEVDDAVARLFKAVEASDAAEVEAALASGASVTSINAAGQTALHLAAEGEPHVVGVLVSCADCPLDALDAEGRTALMLAIAYHDGESVAKLVGAGASVDVEDREGKNATAYAEDSGDAAIIKAVTGKDVEAKEHVPPPPASRSMSKRSSFTSGSVDPATIDRASIPIVEKSEEVQAYIRDAVHENILFNSLDEATFSAVIMAMAEKNVAEGTAVLTQGEENDHFYVVQSGSFTVFKCEEGRQPSLENPGERVRNLGEKDCFGETALMYESPSEVSVIANTESKLWTIDYKNFRAFQLTAAHHKEGVAADGSN